MNQRKSNSRKRPARPQLDHFHGVEGPEEPQLLTRSHLFSCKWMWPSTRNTCRTQGTVCHNMSQYISPQRLRGEGEPAATMVVSRGAQVKQGLEPARARGAQSMPSLPLRASAREALVEARVVFSGRWWRWGEGSPYTAGMLLQPRAELQVLRGEGKGNITAYLNGWCLSSEPLFNMIDWWLQQKQHR